MGVLGTLFICLALIHLFTGTQLRSQSIYGTITGTVVDPSGGAVASANITLKNVASGDVRRSVTNSDGYYSFSSVPAGSYSLTVEAPGFQKAVTQGIDVTGAASLSFPVKLVLGAASQQIVVEAAGDQIIPTDSGEKAARRPIVNIAPVSCGSDAFGAPSTS